MKRRTPKSFRPTLEVLESRLVPTTFTVNTTADSLALNVLSLRRAIALANIYPGPDTIVLPAGTYSITRPGADDTNVAGDFDVTDSLSIVGQGGKSATIIEGNPALLERLFDAYGAINV